MKKEIKTTAKFCTRCQTDKPSTEFSKRAASRDGLAPWCKTCSNSYSKEWHEANKKHRNALSRRWNTANRDRKRVNDKRWRDDNSDKVRVWFAEFKAKQLGLPSEKYTFDQVIEKSDGFCGVCLDPVDLTLEHPDLQRRSLDHIIPYDRGGPNYLSNVQLSHLSCNVRKNTKLLGEMTR